jgi:hypothetical protein
MAAPGLAIGTPHKMFQAANLPVVQMKVRVSNTAITSDTVAGLSDSATVAATNDLRPTNGIYFWTNNSSTGWVAETSNGGTKSTLAGCGGTISTTQFALLRFEVINSSQVHFYADSDLSNGVQMQDCGLISSNVPSVALAPEIYGIQTTAATNNVDVDYVRIWQDDNVASTDGVDTTNPNTTSSDLSTPPLTEDGAQTTADQVGIIDFTTATSDDTIFEHNVYVKGTLFADKIKANEIEGLSIFTDQLASLQQKLNEASSTTTNPDGTTTTNTIIQTATTTLNLSDGLTVGGDANFHGNVFFYKLVTFTEKTLFNNDVTFAAHITTDGTAPTTNLEAAAGDINGTTNQAKVTLDGNDNSGSLNITAGDNAASGKVISMTFAKPFAKAPRVILSASNDQAASAKYYVQSTAAGFTIYVIDPLASGANLQFNYFVIQ